MDMLYSGLIIVMMLLSSALITFDFSFSYRTKRLLFRTCGIFASFLIGIKLPFLENGNFTIGICFAIWIVCAGIFFAFSNDFCRNCAYPFKKIIFKTKYCPKCGNKLHPGENKNV